LGFYKFWDYPVTTAKPSSDKVLMRWEEKIKGLLGQLLP
jgi:hypothetical protein